MSPQNLKDEYKKSTCVRQLPMYRTSPASWFCVTQVCLSVGPRQTLIVNLIIHNSTQITKIKKELCFEVFVLCSPSCLIRNLRPRDSITSYLK